MLLLACCRYTKDLPVGVTRMNEECLKLKDHTAGYQTVQDIQRVVTEAIGGRAALRNEQLIDEVMVRLLARLSWMTLERLTESASATHCSAV